MPITRRNFLKISAAVVAAPATMLAPKAAIAVKIPVVTWSHKAPILPPIAVNDGMDIEAWLARKISEKMAIAEDMLFLSGDGSQARYHTSTTDQGDKNDTRG